jgi:hypothetical protein
MGRAGLTIGLILLALSVLFVCQAGGVVYETVARPDLTSHIPIHEFFLTTPALVLLNIWVVWAAIKLAGLRDQIPRVPLRVFALSVATVLVGHAAALWLASKGTSVGLW